jgi:Xaa-Pro aminopeptidase
VRLPTREFLAARHARLRAALDTLNVDAIVITHPPNIRYLSNHAGSAGVLVMTADAAHLLVDFRYRETVQQLQASDAACPGLRIVDVPASYDEALLECLEEIGVSTVGFEAAHVSVAKHEWWQKTVAGRQMTLKFRATERVVEDLRMIKDAAEIATLRESARRIAPVAHAAFAAARAGVLERDVAAAIETAMRQAGYERPAFDTIVGSGPNSALPHYRAGDRMLAGGDLVVLDFGGVLDGYCSDLTRTVAIGPISTEARRIYDAVYDAQRAAIAAVRPGVATTAVDAAARDVLEQRGLGPAFGHGTGHGLGLDVHEDPRVTKPRSDVPAIPLAPGMVFTIEPGAYVAGFAGVRIEDDVLVTDTGCEVLTDVPRELIIL